MNLENKILITRKKKKFRQVDLAARTGVPVQIISFIEREKYVADDDLKKKIARALNVRVSELFSK